MQFIVDCSLVRRRQLEKRQGVVRDEEERVGREEAGKRRGGREKRRAREEAGERRGGREKRRAREEAGERRGGREKRRVREEAGEREKRWGEEVGEKR